MSQNHEKPSLPSPNLSNKSRKYVYKDGRFSKQRFQRRKDRDFREEDVKYLQKTVNFF